MKTFDIAIYHLNGLDFSAGIYSPETKERIESAHIRYTRDPENKKSNEYYRNLVFVAAIRHKYDLWKRVPSNFSIACSIIESEKYILTKKIFFDLIPVKYDVWQNTIYPKVMFDKFLAHCRSLPETPDYLCEDSETRFDFFGVAYHYIVDTNS